MQGILSHLSFHSWETKIIHEKKKKQSAQLHLCVFGITSHKKNNLPPSTLLIFAHKKERKMRVGSKETEAHPRDTHDRDREKRSPGEEEKKEDGSWNYMDMRDWASFFLPLSFNSIPSSIMSCLSWFLQYLVSGINSILRQFLPS